MSTWCQVRPCLHLAADGTGRNATNLQSRNAFSADPWRKTNGQSYKEKTSMGRETEREGKVEREFQRARKGGASEQWSGIEGRYIGSGRGERHHCQKF
uniref:Uncharacterized protein n=1 Tax=Arundo donax TaxID=35708 RepID=A0A0A9GMS4_ARUDO